MMADRVVDRFEAVDVDVDDREMAIPARLVARCRLNDLGEAGAVEQPGHAVGARRLDCFLLAVGEFYRELAGAEGGDESKGAEQGERTGDRRRNPLEYGKARIWRRPHEAADALAVHVDNCRKVSGNDGSAGCP